LRSLKMMLDPVLQQELSRRQFVKQAALFAAGFSVLGFLPAGCASSPPPGPLKVLTPKEYAIAQAVFSTLIPSLGSGDPTIQEVGAIEFFDAYLATDRPDVAKQLKQVLSIVEYAPLISAFPPRRFTTMAEANREPYLASWRDSRFEFRRTVYVVLRRLAMVSYYRHEATWQTLHYDGPWVGGSRQG
jgi:hypothetical protein